ncbi:LapA family protein [bacterium]|nr:LapA family protein [bacterium]
MGVIRTILVIIFIFAVIAISILNQTEIVGKISLGFTELENVPLVLVLIETFVIGFLYATIAYLLQSLNSRATIRRYRRRIKELESELEAMRNLPLEDIEIEEQGNGG